MSASEDIAVIESQPRVKIWGEGFGEFKKTKVYKGKFVITDSGKVFVKLFPKKDWDKVSFFHNQLVEEVGVKNLEGKDMKNLIIGGGKMEIEFIEDYVECCLYGKSGIYGNYNPDDIDTSAIEDEICDVFGLGDMSVLVIPDFEK